jgi:hypothetical protein
MAVVFGVMFSTHAEAQLISRYTSQQEIPLATEVARDSVSPDAILIAIATAGEIDLSPVGLPGSVEGFSDQDGTSAVWAYQFASPGGEEEGAVVIVKSGVFPTIAEYQEGNDYGVAAVELDLSGSFSGSDQFAARLRENPLYTAFRGDYPDMVADAIVFTWEPDEDLASIPTSFPDTHPIWAIFFNTESWEVGDSSLVCFVSSADGQSHCVRSNTTNSVSSASASTRLTTIEILGNVVSSRDQSSLTAVIDPVDTFAPLELGLYDLAGRKVFDLFSQLQTESRAGGPFTIEFSAAGLPSGEYFLSLVEQHGVTGARLIVE